MSDSPKHLVNSLSIEEQIYETAKKLLEEAFASPGTQTHDAISRLAKLKFDARNPYTYVGDLRAVLNSFDRLEINMDSVKEYFVWNSLGRSFQDEIIQLTNKSKPSLNEINDNIFVALERFQRHAKSKVETSINVVSSEIVEESSINAISIEKDRSKQYSCSLCRSDDVNHNHSMFNCPVYTTPKVKVNKLLSLNACTQCSFLNHCTKDCRFKFKQK